MKLGNIALEQFINTANRTGQDLGNEFLVINEDIKTIHNFLKYHEGLLTNTSDVTSVARISGIDAGNILVSPATVDGTFYNTTELRPKTILESLQEVYDSIDISLANSLPLTEIQNIKTSIGINRFDNLLVSDEGSIDADLNKLSLWIKQIAADCFNYDTRQGAPLNEDMYSFSDSNTQSQHMSLADKIDKIISIHGSLGSLGHHDNRYMEVWPALFAPNTEILAGQKLVTCPHVPSESLVDETLKDTEAFRYYNNSGRVVVLEELTAQVSFNSIQYSTIISIYKNGQETNFKLAIGRIKTGPAVNNNNEIELYPNEYIQFHIDTSEATSGSINILNISVRAREKG